MAESGVHHQEHHAILGRRAYFSCGHNWARNDWNTQQNQNAFGEFCAPAGFGRNFICEAQISGPLDIQTGMIMDLGELDGCLAAVTGALDHKFLNSDVSYFLENVPCTEGIAKYLFNEVATSLEKKSIKARLVRLRLIESDDLWADVFDHGQALSWTRRYSVSCLHRHHNPDLSEEENNSLFRKCSGVHGHEYKIDISLRARWDELNADAKRRELDRSIEKEIMAPLRGTLINDKIVNPSGEAILEYLSAQVQRITGNRFAGMSVNKKKKNSFWQTADAV